MRTGFADPDVVRHVESLKADIAQRDVEIDRLKEEVERLTARVRDQQIDLDEYAGIEKARHEKRMDELEDAIGAIRNLPSVKELDALRTRQDKLAEALREIANHKVGGFADIRMINIARAALAIENEVTADGHVRDEAKREEEVMEGGGK